MRTKEEIQEALKAMEILLSRNLGNKEELSLGAKVVIKMQVHVLQWCLGNDVNGFSVALKSLRQSIGEQDEKSKCPYCRATMEGPPIFVSIDEGAAQPPAPGNFWLCPECAGIGVFNEDLSLRKANFEEMKSLITDDELRILVNRGREEILKRRR